MHIFIIIIVYVDVHFTSHTYGLDILNVFKKTLKI
jgi:hypothetical protein